MTMGLVIRDALSLPSGIPVRRRNPSSSTQSIGRGGYPWIGPEVNVESSDSFLFLKSALEQIYFG